MKGLMFNLLESLASDAGCSEEAWELVAEFAAADGLVDGLLSRERLWGSDIHPRDVFEVPTEAMLNCLTRDNEGEGGLDLIDLEGQQDWLGVEPLTDVIPSFYDALPRGAESGFGPSAFAEPERLVDGVQDGFADLDFDDHDDDRDWDDDELYGLPDLTIDRE